MSLPELMSQQQQQHCMPQQQHQHGMVQQYQDHYAGVQFQQANTWMVQTPPPKSQSSSFEMSADAQPFVYNEMSYGSPYTPEKKVMSIVDPASGQPIDTYKSVPELPTSHRPTSRRMPI